MEPTDWRRKPASDNQGRGAGAGGGPHLVHVDVVEVVFVVNGLEHALQLPRGAAVDHQHEGDSDGVGEHIFHRVLVPLHVLVGFAWGKTRETTGRGEHPRFFAGGGGGWGASLMLHLGDYLKGTVMVIWGPETSGSPQACPGPLRCPGARMGVLRCSEVPTSKEL